MCRKIWLKVLQAEGQSYRLELSVPAVQALSLRQTERVLPSGLVTFVRLVFCSYLLRLFVRTRCLFDASLPTILWEKISNVCTTLTYKSSDGAYFSFSTGGTTGSVERG